MLRTTDKYHDHLLNSLKRCITRYIIGPHGDIMCAVELRKSVGLRAISYTCGQNSVIATSLLFIRTRHNPSCQSITALFNLT